MPEDISGSLCLPSAGINVGIPSPDLTIDEIDTLVEVEVAAVELVEQITRCSSVQFGSNVHLTNCTFDINIMKL